MCDNALDIEVDHGVRCVDGRVCRSSGLLSCSCCLDPTRRPLVLTSHPLSRHARQHVPCLSASPLRPHCASMSYAHQGLSASGASVTFHVKITSHALSSTSSCDWLVQDACCASTGAGHTNENNGKSCARPKKRESGDLGIRGLWNQHGDHQHVQISASYRRLAAPPRRPASPRRLALGAVGCSWPQQRGRGRHCAIR